MSIPNHIDVVRRLKAEYPAEWSAAHRGGPRTEDFVRRLAWELHKIDPRWGLNGKRGNPNDLSDDCVNYDGEASGGDYDPTRGNAPVTVVDFIAAAPSGPTGPDGTPAWSHPLTPAAAAWVKPKPVAGGGTVGGGGTPIEPPKPAHKPYPGDAYYVNSIGAVLEADYAEAGQTLNAGSATWFGRVDYDHFVGGMTMDDSVKKHRAEWRAALGLPT